MCNRSSSSPSVTNCTFSGNSTGANGGGMHNRGNSSPTVVNCTFHGNSAVNRGGGMYNLTSAPTVTNCIIWANSANHGAQVSNRSGSSPTITYSDIQRNSGTYSGIGNINLNPNFVTGSLRLSATSPCIDSGNNSAVPADTADLDNDGNTSEATPYDLDNNTRIIDGDNDSHSTTIVDMGAYEYQPPVSP